MAREPKNYEILRDEHAAQTQNPDKKPQQASVQQQIEAEHRTRASDAENSEEIGPFRPADRHEQSPGWTSAGGMKEQQDSARAWVAESSKRREAAADATAETDAAPVPQALKGEGEAPEMSDARRSMIEQAEARTPPERPTAPAEGQTKSTGKSR
jgi:hypothetical protein